MENNINIKSKENDKKITWNTIFRLWSIVDRRQSFYIPLYDENDVKK